MMTGGDNKDAAPSVGAREIRLPVIKSLTVNDYPLYPGKKNDGVFSHQIDSGVTVIAGINGQGKTTLLNILYRMLVGPWDQTKADYQNPGKKQHQLTMRKKFNFFAERIGRSGESSRATLVLQIGGEEVTITRNLGVSLSITKLMKGAQPLAPDEDTWFDTILELTGLSNHYDFHFVVRNFLFFLEDKVPLLWNPYGQFEILRILFLPKELADQCAGIHDKILKLDSQYRNDHWQLTLFKDRLNAFRKQYGDDSEIKDLIDSLATTQVRYESLVGVGESLDSEIEGLYVDIRGKEEALFKHEMELHDIYGDLQTIESEYFERAFPDAKKTAELVYSELLLNRACVICGQDDHGAQKRIADLLEQHLCPACESPIDSGDQVVGVEGFDHARLKAAEKKSEDTKQRIAELQRQIRDDRNSLKELQEKREENRLKILPLETAVRRARSAVDDSIPQEIQSLESEYEKLKAVNLSQRNELASMRAEYEATLSQASAFVENTAQSICDCFQKYADHFLHQSASLSYEMHERAVGQSGQRLKFPNFIVKIKSEVMPDLLTRFDSEQVSESQREFVDLAFRMALFETAVAQYGPAMLVVETPEASLDAVFIERAGRMLRQFAASFDGNRLIATCNLNGENMIGWLLGTIDKSESMSESSKEEVESRIINLLKEGLPTAGYLAEPGKYDQAFEKAING